MEKKIIRYIIFNETKKNRFKINLSGKNNENKWLSF